MFIVRTGGLLYELNLKVAEWGDLNAGEITELYKAAENWLSFVEGASGNRSKHPRRIWVR